MVLLEKDFSVAYCSFTVQRLRNHGHQGTTFHRNSSWSRTLGWDKVQGWRVECGLYKNGIILLNIILNNQYNYEVGCGVSEKGNNSKYSIGPGWRLSHVESLLVAGFNWQEEQCSVLFLVGETHTPQLQDELHSSNFFKDSQMYLPELFEFLETTMQIILSFIKMSQHRIIHYINSGGSKSKKTILDSSLKAHNYLQLKNVGLNHYIQVS